MFSQKAKIGPVFFAILFILATTLPNSSEAAMQLIERLARAKAGDYIVTAIDKTYTVLIVKEKNDQQILIEEITTPLARIKQQRGHWQGWRKWVESGAPGNTSWVLFTVTPSTGSLQNYYSYTRGGWYNMPSVDNFFSKLLSLQMVRVPRKDLKRVGPSPAHGAADRRRTWEPQMVFEGKVIPGVSFKAWYTKWPRDGGDLSGKSIIVYVPEDDQRYPAYFPYWLEIRGFLGKAKVRIIDSGRELQSPAKIPVYERT